MGRSWPWESQNRALMDLLDKVCTRLETRSDFLKIVVPTLLFGRKYTRLIVSVSISVDFRDALVYGQGYTLWGPLRVGHAAPAWYINKVGAACRVLMIPQDILEELIFPTLTFGQLVNLRQVSKGFKEAVDDSRLWNEMYCTQFNAPPVIPHTAAASAFLKRCSAKLLRTQITEPDSARDFAYDMESLVPNLRRDWTKNPATPSGASIFDFKCLGLAREEEEPEAESLAAEAAGGEGAGAVATEDAVGSSVRSHLFCGFHIRKVRMLPLMSVVLTLEGDIWITGQMGLPQVYTQAYPGARGTHFVDVQIQGETDMKRMIGLDDQGSLYFWVPESGLQSMGWSSIVTGLDVLQFDIGYSPAEVVYLNYRGLYVQGGSVKTRFETGAVKDFVCLKAGRDFRMVILIEDGTLQEISVGPPNRNSTTKNFTESGRGPLNVVNKFLGADDSLHSIAGHSGSDEINNRVWLLTEKGRLIEVCFGQNGPFANLYRGLEGIVSVSLGPHYRDHYAHHWDGNVYWLDEYTFTPFKIESDPCVFRYLQRTDYETKAQFVGITALYI